MKPELYWIEGPWPGRLAISGRPRGNDWLEDEVRGWKSSGINTIVSLLTPDEEAEFGLEEEGRIAELNDVTFVRFPVPDRSVPADFGGAIQLVRELESGLSRGQNVALHCRQGIGRSALLAAGLLVTAGLEPDAAFARLADARGRAVPETAEQRSWVTRFAREVVPTAADN